MEKSNNNDIDKFTLLMCIFNFIFYFTPTHYGNLYSYLTQNDNNNYSVIAIIIFILCYYLSKKYYSKYSAITLGILIISITLFIFIIVFKIFYLLFFIR